MLAERSIGHVVARCPRDISLGWRSPDAICLQCHADKHLAGRPLGLYEWIGKRILHLAQRWIAQRGLRGCCFAYLGHWYWRAMEHVKRKDWSEWSSWM